MAGEGLRFEVKRASIVDAEEESPCEEATPADFSYYVEHGPHVGAGPYTQRLWYVELANLDALLQFRAKYGELILGVSIWDHVTPAITIYDDYVE